MSTKKMKFSPVVGFSFEEIPLSIARNLVLAGKGKYGDVIADLLDKLPEIDKRNESLPPSEQVAYAFGLGEKSDAIADAERVQLLKQCNTALKKADVGWKIYYSVEKKIFICSPFKGYSKVSKALPAKPMTMSAPENSVVEDFVKKCCSALNIPREKLLDRFSVRKERTAICKVARGRFSAGVLSPYVGISNSGVSYAASKNSSAHIGKELEILNKLFPGGSK